VEYESAAGADGDDPFGLNAFVSEVDRGRRPLDSIGQRGRHGSRGWGGGYEGRGAAGGGMQFTSGGR